MFGIEEATIALVFALICLCGLVIWVIAKMSDWFPDEEKELTICPVCGGSLYVDKNGIIQCGTCAY